MTTSWSLTNRIFLATALMAILSIGLAIYVVNVAVTRHPPSFGVRRLPVMSHARPRNFL